MHSRRPTTIAAMALALLTFACAAPPPEDSPEARLEGARTIARTYVSSRT